MLPGAFLSQFRTYLKSQVSNEWSVLNEGERNKKKGINASSIFNKR